MSAAAAGTVSSVTPAPVASAAPASGGTQQSVLQSIVAQLVQQSQNGGVTPAAAAQTIQNSLTQSGQFDPTQIQAIVAKWNASNNPAGGVLTDKGGGNTAAETQDWNQELLTALNQNPNTTSAAQLANGGNPSANGSTTGTPSAGENAATAAAPLGQTTQTLFQPTYMAAPATGAASTYTGSASPDQTIQAIYANLNPQFAQANSNLNNQLAAAGIEGGGAIDAQQQLQSAETGQLGSAVQAAIQSAQGLNQQAGLQNTQATNEFNLQNLQNLYNTNAYNTQASNTSQQDYINALLGQYNTDANSFNNLNTTGLAGQTGLNSQGLNNASGLTGTIANNYQVQTGAGTGVQNLATQLGSAFNTPTGTTTPSTTETYGQQGYQVS
jgi:hypothetical protein